MPSWIFIVIVAVAIIIGIKVASKIVRFALVLLIAVFGVYMYLNHLDIGKSLADTRNVALNTFTSVSSASSKLKDFAEQNSGYEFKKVSDNEYTLKSKDGLTVELKRENDKSKLVGSAPKNNPDALKALSKLVNVYVGADSKVTLETLANSPVGFTKEFPSVTIKADKDNIYVETK